MTAMSSQRPADAGNSILFINPASSRYVPMGVFGLCDYLDAQTAGTPIIFHARLHEPDQVIPRLKQTIQEHSPRYLGIILHWKESLEESLTLARRLKRDFPDRLVILGGLTAGFLAEELLERFPFIDLVIKGDAEVPLKLLLDGLPFSRIPNSFHRDSGKPTQTGLAYQIDAETLNTISFSKLDYLLDAGVYVDKLGQNLGFPVFIGRGCPYNCLYCGGSSKAFHECYQNNNHPVRRSIPSLLADLKRLLPHTDLIYICYETDLAYLKTLFRAIIDDQSLPKRFVLNYGTWSIVDQDFLDLYKAAFRFGPTETPVFEISPETSINRDRRIIRDPKLYFSNQKMLACIKQIQTTLENQASVKVFYSRYHLTQDTRTKLQNELVGIYRIMEHLYRNRMHKVLVSFNHLSTDPGSHYWDQVNLDESGACEVLTRALRKCARPTCREPMLNNLCIYRPASLKEGDYVIFEHSLRLFFLLRDKCPVYFFHITKTMGIKCFLKTLECVVKRWLDSESFYHCSSANPIPVMEAIHRQLKSEPVYPENHQYFDNLHCLWISVQYEAPHDMPSPLEYLENERWPIIEKPVLVPERIVITRYNFLSTHFYDSLTGTADKLTPRQTVNIIHEGKVTAFDYVYHQYLQMLNGKNSLEDICSNVQSNRELDIQQSRRFELFLQTQHDCFTR